MELRYTGAQAPDVEALYLFNKDLIDRYEDVESIDYEKVLNWVYRKIRNNIRAYTCVYEQGRKAAYFYFHEADGKMEIDDLYVLPEFRNRGIGTQIIQKCCSETDKPVFLYVFAKNKGAVSLYARLGFRITEHIRNTRYIMQRDC